MRRTIHYYVIYILYEFIFSHFTITIFLYAIAGATILSLLENK